MPNVYIGMLVQTPAVPLLNNGEDKMPAVITAIGDAGPNGGVMCSVKTLPNAALTLIAYDASVEVVDYESTARALGVGQGAWPLDYA